MDCFIKDDIKSGINNDYMENVAIWKQHAEMYAVRLNCG